MSSADFFSKSTFSKNSLVSKSLDPDQACKGYQQKTLLRKQRVKKMKFVFSCS